MLDYDIISNKPIVTKDGERFIDLLTETYRKNIIPKCTPLIVDEYYEARPDLIALATYGSDKYADMICKVNGISNPFELAKGRLIYIPRPQYCGELILSSRTGGSEFVSKKEKSIFGNNVVDKEDTIIKRENNLQKNKNERRTPGDQVIGDKNYVIDKSLGVVFY